MIDAPLPLSEYDTPEGSGKLFSRLFPNLTFYAKLIYIVYWSGRMAHKHTYDTPDWIRGSVETLRALEDVGATAHVRGGENILKPDGPCVFIANHMSTMETFVLPCLIAPHRPVTFVVKDTLVRYPYFGAVLKSRDPIVIGRDNPRVDLAAVLEGGVERLKQGISIIIFPQSTRSPGFDPHHFNSAGIKLAKKAGVPVVPVALRTDAWGVGKKIKDVGPINRNLPIHFTFGEPLEIAGNGKAEHAAVCHFIRSHLEGWGLPTLTQGEGAKELPPGGVADPN